MVVVETEAKELKKVDLSDIVLDESVERFLADLKPGTAEAYRPAMKHFTVFLHGFDFKGEKIVNPSKVLDLISADQALPVREKKFIARAIIIGFREYLESVDTSARSKPPRPMAEKGILAKVGALQSYGKYYEVSMSTKYTQMPEPIVQTKSYPWTTESFGKFMGLIETSLYKALTACLYQSGLGIGDALALRYKVIQEEFESETIPVCLDLIRHKTSVDHITFLSTETVTFLKDYFAENGTPKPNDLIFPVQDRSVEGYFATRAQMLLGKYEGRNPCGPHSLRKFFRKSVVNAGCPESYAEYWEGHNLKADLRKIYTAMSPDEWRVEYEKYMNALSFEVIKDGDSE